MGLITGAALGLESLRRVVVQRGPGFVELLVGDGLYMTPAFFRFCQEERGCHGVVKTDEETLTLRQDADGLFDAKLCLPGVGSVEGVDAQRAVAYQIWAASGFEWEGLADPLRIARVGRNPAAMVRLVLLLFLAFVLVHAYRLKIEAVKEVVSVAAAWEPVAFRFLRQLFWLSLDRVELTGGLKHRASVPSAIGHSVGPRKRSLEVESFLQGRLPLLRKHGMVKDKRSARQA